MSDDLVPAGYEFLNEPCPQCNTYRLSTHEDTEHRWCYNTGCDYSTRRPTLSQQHPEPHDPTR